LYLDVALENFFFDNKTNKKNLKKIETIYVCLF